MKVQVWRFGDIEFDESAGRLRVAGKPVEIDRSCRAILAVLLENAGATVDKDQLLRAGWPDRIVHENSLAKAIGRLREALGGDGPALRSIYGYGYRIEAKVKRAKVRWKNGEEQRPVAATAGESRPSSIRWRPVAVAGSAGLVLVAAAAVGLPGLETDSLPSPSETIRTSPPITRDAPDSIGKILWVDDNPQNNLYEKRLFEDRRIAVHNVTSSADALRLMAIYRYDLVISDMGRGEDRLAGLHLVEALRERGIETPLLIYTVRADGPAEQKAQRELVAEAGADGLAVTPEEIRRAVLRTFGYPAPRPAD